MSLLSGAREIGSGLAKLGRYAFSSEALAEPIHEYHTMRAPWGDDINVHTSTTTLERRGFSVIWHRRTTASHPKFAQRAGRFARIKSLTHEVDGERLSTWSWFMSSDYTKGVSLADWAQRRYGR